MSNNITGNRMASFGPSRSRYAGILDLSAKSIIFISVLSLNELIFMMTGLRRTASVILIIPAGFMIMHYWSHFLENRVVLTFIVPLVVYCLLALAYGTFSGSVDFGLVPSISICIMLFLSISLHIVKSDEKTVDDLVEFSRNILFLASAAIVLSPWYYPYMPELVKAQTYDHRFSGFFTSPNDASLAAVLFLNFVLYRPFKSNIINVFAMVLVIFAIYFTLSKTGIILFVTSFLVFLILKHKWFFLSVFSVSLLAIWYFVGMLYERNSALPLDLVRSNRMRNIIDFFTGSLDRIGHKDILWYDAIMRIKHNFPHGAGLGTFHRLVDSVYENRMEEGTVNEIDDWLGVHNMYLMIFGEAGFVAFFVFVVCYGKLIKLALFSSKDKLPFAIILISLGFFGAVHDAFEMRAQMVILAVAIGLLSHDIMKNLPGTNKSH